jgi:hypothetical protein
MNNTIGLQKKLLILGVPLLMIATMIWISKSSFFKTHSDTLAIGITVDLLLTIPFIYFLGIRKTRIPKTTIVPFLLIGMVVCSFILPSENQYYLSLFKTWVFPIIEISIISFVVYKIRKATLSYRKKKGSSLDFFTTLKNTCYEILPKGVVIPVVTEIAVFYYGFIYWKKRILKENEFSYHKESGTISLLVAILLIITTETIVFHVLLGKSSTTAAWIFTCVSIYSGIQIFGFLKSIYKRPIFIKDGKLYLRYGIMNESIIDLKNIESVEISSKDLELDKKTRKLSFLGALESHNIIIKLQKENTLTGLYGIERTYTTIAIHVDDKNSFKKAVTDGI